MLDEKDAQTQAKILAALNKYGDSLLEDEPSQKKKKKKNRPVDDTSGEETMSLGRKKRKKQKKAKQKAPDNDDALEDELWEEEEEGVGEKALSSEQRHLGELKRKLGLTSADFAPKKNTETEKSKTQKKASGKSRPEPEIVVFNDPAKRKQKMSENSNTKPLTKKARVAEDDDAPSEDGDDFDMKRAKFDVMMLGIRGMEKSDREKARVDVAIKLGAQAPKKPYVNYKKFQEEKKQEKIEAQAQRLEAPQTGQISKSNIRKRRQRDKNDIGYVDGQVGSYKSGVQVINKRDLQKLTSPRPTDRRGQGRGRGRGGRR